MSPALRDALERVLASPCCAQRLNVTADGALRCHGCGAGFPVVDGIPVLMAAGGEQQVERHYRDGVAAAHQHLDKRAVMRVIGRNHSLAVMIRRVQEFRRLFRADDWILDVGVGWGWHWATCGDGARVLGVDFSLASLQRARRLADPRRVALVCGNAAALPARDGCVAGVWSVQTFQHLPAEVRTTAKAELDRVANHRAVIEIHNLNPGGAVAAAYRLAGRRLRTSDRMSGLELWRLDAAEWLRFWDDFRPQDRRISVGYSELFFHPEFTIGRRAYPLWLERAVASRLPRIAAAIARQNYVRIETGVQGWTTRPAPPAVAAERMS